MRTLQTKTQHCTGVVKKKKKVFKLCQLSSVSFLCQLPDGCHASDSLPDVPHLSCCTIEGLYLLMGRELEELEEVPAGNVLGKASCFSTFPDYGNSLYVRIQNQFSKMFAKMSHVIPNIRNSSSEALCLLPPVWLHCLMKWKQDWHHSVWMWFSTFPCWFAGPPSLCISSLLSGILIRSSTN